MKGFAMDLPPYTPEEEVQVVEQAMAQCNLPAAGYTVTYEEELQSVQILIKADAGAKAEDFPCIRHAGQLGAAVVWFEDVKLLEAYMSWETELMRPQVLAYAKAELQKRGKLAGLPRRKDFDSDAAFGVALEEHCGLVPGSYLVEKEWGLTAQPRVTGEPFSDAEWDRMICMSAALSFLSAKEDGFQIGFVGNEKTRSSD